jgi:hypothetical protein
MNTPDVKYDYLFAENMLKIVAFKKTTARRKI